MPNTLENKLEQDLEKAFETCIHCGMCLSACPTYVQTGDESQSPRGRIHLSQAVHDGRLPFADLVPALETCLGCMACETACPSQVKYHHVLEAGRLTTHAKGLGRFSLLAQVMQAVLKQDALLSFITAGMKLGDALGFRRLLQASWMPRFISEKTRFWMPIPSKGLDADLKRLNPDAELALHLGCVMKHLMPDVHNACLDVLAAMGFSVTASPLGCCGALASHHGLAKETEACLKENAQAWQASSKQTTLSNAGGCGAMLKDYAHLGESLALQDSPAVLAEIARSTEDIHAFIWTHHQRLPALSLETPTVVTYQGSCHLTHAQGVTEAPLALLQQVENLSFIPMQNASSCCGSAGIYNLEHPDLAEAIAQEKVQAILATGADVVVVGNPGCLIQLKASLAVYAPTAKIEVLHPIQVLAEAVKACPTQYQ
ncbi:MAG: (Fe-S)-binding protein [Vampirovibrionales bacterium]|jgi:glycolate oxidase iron-sulfur subunit